MYKYELEPTFDNLYDSIDKDYLNRNQYLFKFYDLLNNISSSASISLDGPWGSGKTFFVKQIEVILKSELKEIDELKNDKAKINEYTKLVSIKEKIEKHKIEKEIKSSPQLPIYYDAWNNDNASDPILSLIYEIVKSLNNMYKFKGKPEILTGLKEIAKSIVSSLNVDINLSDNTITPSLDLPDSKSENAETSSQKKGINLKIDGDKLSSIFDSFEKFKAPDLLEDLKKEDNLHELINKFFDKLSIDKGTRLIIFIDELDRCKPTFAINFLERIKHYFDRQNITFVFSTNIKELKNTVQAYYGSNFDGDGYLDKFFDLRLQIPKVDSSVYLNYLKIEQKYGYKIDYLTPVINYYNLEMRSITRFLKIYEYSKNNYIGNAFLNPSEEHAIGLCKEYILPFLIIVNIKDSKLYEQIINGYGEDEFVNFFTNDLNSLFFRNYDFKNAKEMCQEIYQQIFNDKSYLSSNNISIDENLTQHNLSFTKKHKQYLLEFLSLLSSFSEYRN